MIVSLLPLAAGLMAQPDTDAFLRQPDIHGDHVVFTCEGDLWLGTISTGNATRLTRHEGREEFARFSPDGSTIVFTGQYDGVRELYTIPAEGGVPKRITFRMDYAEPLGWSADGQKVLYRARSYPRSYGLYTVSKNGGPETQLPVEFASHAVYSPSADKIAFTRFNRWSDAWFRYIGGMKNDVWVGDMATKQFKKVTDAPGTTEYPQWHGDSLYYVQEQDGKFSLMSTPANGGRATRHGNVSEIELRELNAGPGGLVYEKGRGIEHLDPATGKVAQLRFRLDSDLMHTRPFTVLAQNHGATPSITPTGKRVLLETRGQIVSLPVGEGEARLWKAQPGVRLQLPMMSPDGTKVAYVSDEGREQQIWLADADGANPRQVTRRTKGQIRTINWSPDNKRISYYDSEMRLRMVTLDPFSDIEISHSNGHNWYSNPHSFSPDGKWLAYSVYDPITTMASIAVRNLDSGQVSKIGQSVLTHDDLPEFSKDGKYLAFVSRRQTPVSFDSIQNQMNTGATLRMCVVLLAESTPNPLRLTDVNEPVKTDGEAAKPAESEDKSTKIDFAGIEQRIVVLPGVYNGIGATGFSGNRVLFAADGVIRFYDLAAKREGVVTPGGGFMLSHDGSKLLIGNRVVDANGTDVPGNAGALSGGNLRLTIDPKAEWEQIFWDSWRLLRDYFYVANMHGLDWPAIGQKYAAMLPSVRSRDELDILIRWMQGETGTSHQYLSPGPTRTQFETVGGAFLGIDVMPDATAGELKITRIMLGDGVDPSEQSPLLVPGFKVSEGDYLLEIGGIALDHTSNYLEVLAGRAGQTVSVTVASKADGSDKRTVYVKPVGEERRMRLLTWVEQNRQYVDKASNGEIGYIYLQAMTTQDMMDFLRQYYPQRNKKALIIDTRFNNGGNVQSIINRVLAETVTGYFNMRGSTYSWSRQGDAFTGPMACLTNEFSVSCGEEFPHRFQDLNIGPVIGRRTYGGEVGSSPGWPLVDGGVIHVPNYGMWTPEDGWVIEGEGISPDIDVQSDPNAFAQGRDAQLDKAIEVMKADIKKKPVHDTRPPSDRVRVGRGQG